MPALRLGDDARPLAYAAELVIVPEGSNFTGQITIDLKLERASSLLWLHGRGLTVSQAHLAQRGLDIPAQPVAGNEEFLGFQLPQPAQAGKATLSIRYTGQMSDKDVSGLFRRQEDGLWYAATQFEATWARRVFPCFDEPAFKAPWRLTVHAKREHTVIGNATVVSETDEPGGMKCVRFAQTSPLSSYLVALAVGPFSTLDLGPVGRKKTPVRIITPKGRTHDAAFAAEAIPQLLRRLEDYYDLPYPYDKLDHIAVPQFMGALENAGAIMYDESLLLSPPDRQTIGFQRDCANVCGHEMAHQWFGDLVTMAWWDDLWLNESFATWITPKIVDRWHPEWQTSLDQLQATFAAAGADNLASARCIRQPIKAASDIDNAFDAITYNKGAAVLGMFEWAMGPDAFRQAIKAYLRRHAGGNAKAGDFLASLNRAAQRNVGADFSTFLDQAGIPLISVGWDDSSKARSRLVLAQRRYLPVGSTGDTRREWRIPLHSRYPSRGQEAQLDMTLDKPKAIVTLKGEPEWVLLNAGAVGYFITAYPSGLLGNLLQASVGKLSAAERMGIAQSLSMAVRSADLPLGEALPLQAGFLLDPERRVVEMAAAFMDVREQLTPGLEPNLQRFVHQRLEPLAKELSWRAARPENDDERLRRLALLALAANVGEDAPLIEAAKALTMAWLKNRQAVPPDEANTILGVAGRHADSALYSALREEAKRAQDPADRQRLVVAMGLARDPALVLQGLEALTAKEFQSMDSLLLLFILSSHLESRSLTYDYVKQHYARIVAALPSDALFAYLPKIAEGFDTPERQSDVESFFKDKDPRLTGGPRIVAQVIESIHLNHAFKEAHTPSLAKFLRTQ